MRQPVFVRDERSEQLRRLRPRMLARRRVHEWHVSVSGCDTNDVRNQLHEHSIGSDELQHQRHVRNRVRRSDAELLQRHVLGELRGWSAGLRRGPLHQSGNVHQ
jgi:hypothetical protein